MKIISLIFFVFSLVLFSCSNSQNLDVSFNDEDTLMAMAERKNSDFIWTSELEELRLSKKLESISGIDSKVNVSLELMALKGSAPVYPVIDGFGHLDDSGISPELSQSISNFIANVCSWNTKTVAVDEKYSFPFALFVHDVENGWAEKFGEDFPKEKVFQKGIYAKAFVDDSGTSVPFRFSNQKGFLDLLVVFDNRTNLIKNIQIMKWGR